MRRLFNIVLWFIVVCGDSALAQNDGDLGNAASRVRQHTKKILDQMPNAERRVRGILQRAKRDAVARDYNVPSGSVKGAKRHPWYESNSNSEKDYKEDSLLMWPKNYADPTFWGCFRLQLVAKGSYLHPEQNDWGEGSEPLFNECRNRCPDFYTEYQKERIEEWDNKWEVIQFHRPEGVAYINDYAIYRLNPAEQSTKGNSYAPSAVRGAKGQSEGKVKQELKKLYPIDRSLEFERRYKDVYELGHEHWGGVATVGGLSAANAQAHVARTRIAYQTANEKVHTEYGWHWYQDSIFDALGTKTVGQGEQTGTQNERDILSIYTEHGLTDALVRIPDLTRQLGGFERERMNALFGSPQIYQEEAKKKEPFWQTRGAMSFRVGKWGSDFGPLRNVLDVQSSSNELLRETVWKGGHELFPLVMNLEGYETPTLSVSQVFARRAFYIAGEKSTERYHPDGQKGRLPTYTVNSLDPGTEVDHMQLIWPRVNGRISECYKSQLIPNMVQTTEDSWIKRNFPHDLVGYVDQHYGDVTVAYWNKRLVCSCRLKSRLGHTGSSLLNNPPDPLVRPQPRGQPNERGSGDRHYGRIEGTICDYPVGHRSSAWEGKDQPPCQRGTKLYYKGLNDNI